MPEYKNVENIRQLFDEEFKKTRYLIQQGETHLDNLAEGFLEADRVIFRIPTEDVVKVVRCKDCKHFKPLSDGSWINQNREDGICYALVNYHDSERYCVRPDHFCSYGELKELG